ncbi:MAG TPA: DM13 domain-containing protein [Nitrosopumilaceae archaeon]|jgi:hypothetical protein|nr:DM13 domain-containing protein [Nitrosopumilaceae archaeon]
MKITYKTIILTVIILTIPLAIYTISPFFTNTVIDEALPTVTANTDQPGLDIAPTIFLSGEFIGIGDGVHDVSGDTIVLGLDDINYLRFENFAAANGPDLHVYLATDNAATEFIDLGLLKANNGNQNYEIPDGTDLDKYNKVLVWCKMFSVLFGSAELQ